MKNSSFTTSLQQIILKKAQNKGWSRKRLVEELGYSNVSKGLRRLNVFLETLIVPSDNFVRRLTEVLGIDVITFVGSYKVSMKALADKEKERFRPTLVLHIDFQPRPWFAAQFVRQWCTIPLPKDLRNLSMQDELAAIFNLFSTRLNMLNYKERVTGFVYVRQYDACLIFDKNGVLVKIEPERWGNQKSDSFGRKVIELQTDQSK